MVSFKYWWRRARLIRFPGGLSGLILLAVLASVVVRGDVSDVPALGFALELGEYLGSKPIWVAGNAWLLCLPLAAMLLGFLLRWTLAPRRPRLPAQPQSAPPDDITPAELGMLLGRGGYARRVAATLVHLAVRGHLHLAESARHDYVLRFGRNSVAGFAPHELEWLEPAQEGVGGTVRLRSLQRWSTGSSEALGESLLERRYFKSSPVKARANRIVAATCLCSAGLALTLPPDGITAAKLLAALVAWGISCVFVLPLVPRTQRGTRALEQALGFARWLSEVELSRLRDREQARRIFEHYLPYAMVLGQEAHWARGFSSQPPALDWYRGLAGEPVEASVLTGRLCAAIPRVPWKPWIHALRRMEVDD